MIRSDVEFERIVRELVSKELRELEYTYEMGASNSCSETVSGRGINRERRYTLGKIREFDEEIYKTLVQELRQLDNQFTGRIM